VVLFVSGMARSPRIEYPNAQYHILARGNRREPIVRNDGDRKMFVRTLAEACKKSQWELFAWVLMDNHYHLALRTPKANLVEGMKWLQNTYTRRINTRHQNWGHLFGGRYKSILVESQDKAKGDSWVSYWSTLIDYIHLNPARAGIVDGVQTSVMDYRWCSLAQDYALPDEQRTGWVEVTQGLELFQLEDTVQGRRQYIDRLDNRVIAEGEKAGLAENREGARASHLQKGWYWGTQEFRECILKEFSKQITKKKNRNYQSGLLNKEHSLEQAEAILRQACQHYGVKEKALLADRRGDLRKISVARKIWQETTVSQHWIAERLKLKSPANVSQRIRRFSELADKDLSDEILRFNKLSEFVD
jgi:putative transposase